MEYPRKELDRYDQGGRQKIPPYEKGQSTVFLDGRLLRNVEYIRTSVVNALVPATFVGILQINWNTEKDRASYFESIEIDSDEGVLVPPDAIVLAGQLWANGNRFFSFFAPLPLSPINVYVPPSSNISLYLFVSNAWGIGSVNVWTRMNLNSMTFSAIDDIWNFGSGSGAANPAGFPP